MSNKIFGPGILCLMAACVVTACSKQDSQQAPKRTDTFGVECPSYSPSEFLKLSSFQAKVLEKGMGRIPDLPAGKTNILVSILLEKADGQRLIVSDYPASDDLMKIFRLLEKDHIYTLPDAVK
jgi:hypothetical protein